MDVFGGRARHHAHCTAVCSASGISRVREVKTPLGSPITSHAVTLGKGQLGPFCDLSEEIQPYSCLWLPPPSSGSPFYPGIYPKPDHVLSTPLVPKRSKGSYLLGPYVLHTILSGIPTDLIKRIGFVFVCLSFLFGNRDE